MKGPASRGSSLSKQICASELKYILGDFQADVNEEAEDPYAESVSEEMESLSEGMSLDERHKRYVRLQSFVERICRVAQHYRKEVEEAEGELAVMESERHNEMLDRIQVKAGKTRTNTPRLSQRFLRNSMSVLVMSGLAALRNRPLAGRCGGDLKRMQAHARSFSRLSSSFLISQ